MTTTLFNLPSSPTKKQIIERLFNDKHITFDEMYTLLTNDRVDYTPPYIPDQPQFPNYPIYPITPEPYNPLYPTIIYGPTTATPNPPITTTSGQYSVQFKNTISD